MAKVTSDISQLSKLLRETGCFEARHRQDVWDGLQTIRGELDSSTFAKELAAASSWLDNVMKDVHDEAVQSFLGSLRPFQAEDEEWTQTHRRSSQQQRRH